MASDIEAFDAAMEAPLQTENFEIVPGVTLKLRQIAGFDTMVEMAERVDAQLAIAKKCPVTVGGRVVQQGPAVVKGALTLVDGVQEPALDYKRAVQFIGRYGIQAIRAVNRINELSAVAEPEQQIEQAKAALEADPTEPSSSTSPSGT